MKWLDNFIVSERGQWEHPRKLTAVPTKNGRITMQGVPYPVFAMDETGYGGMIYPGGNYQFPGKMVYEIPMAQYGNQIKKSIVSAEELPEDAFPYEGTSAMFKDERYNIDRAKKLYTEDEFGHLPSIDYETGEWLKAKRYPTSWKEFLQYTLNPEVNKLGFPTENKEGFLRYPNYANGGDISIPDLSRPNWLDKAQKGQQVRQKIYTDPLKFAKAKEIHDDSLSDYLKNKNIYESYSGAVYKQTYDEIAELAEKNKRDYGWAKSNYPQKPQVEPVYKEKPKEYIPTKTPRLEREPLQLVMPQSDRILDDYNNTRQVLRGVQEEDKSNQNLYPTRVVLAPDFRHGGWLDKYQGDEGSSQVPANFLWIDQDGQFRDVPIPVPPPKTFEEKVDDFLGNPQLKAMNLNRRINNDNLRHSAASMHTTESLGSTLGAAILAQGLGAAHEISSLPKRIQDTKTDDVGYYDNIYHNVIESGEDVINNAIGSMVGMIPFIPTKAKESLLVYLSNNNMLPDGKSMPEGNEYVPKKKSGGWLDEYQGDTKSSQVAANLPWLGTKGQVLSAGEQEEKLLDKKFGIGPTVDKAEAIKAKERLKKTKRIETPLPSGAITPVMGPVEYALMAPVAASTVSAAAPIIGSGLNASIAGIPGLTVGNALGAGFATDAIVNRLPQIPGQLSRGEYMDAAINAGTGALDLYGAGMVSPLFKGVKAAKKLPGSPNSGNVVDELREELQREGIVQSQKTLNLPWKNIIRKGVTPWTYDIPNKVDDIKSLIFSKIKNPAYTEPDEIERQYQQYKKFLVKPGAKVLSKDEYVSQLDPDMFFRTRKEVVNNRFNTRFSENQTRGIKNRYTTWDMYLGKPQIENPMYDISHLTKSKDDVIYTIKEDFMDKPAIENRLAHVIGDIETGTARTHRPVAKKIGDNKWIHLDNDSYFGGMGGFHWDIKKLPNGNYEAYANDVWDLQPFKLRDLPKSIRNIEVGKALGIGKPLNVKVGFEIDKDTKKILKTYGMAPGAVAGAAAMQKEKDGGSLDEYQVGSEVNCPDGNCRETDQIQAIYDNAQRIPERVTDFELGVAENLWFDPSTKEEKKYLVIGKEGDDAREIWKQHGVDNFVAPSCMYTAGLGWRCAPETKGYMSNFNPTSFNSNTGFIDAVNKGTLPFNRVIESNQSDFDSQKAGNLRPGDIVNFKGPGVSHGMTFTGYDEKGNSKWFHSPGSPSVVDIQTNLWKDLRSPEVKKYVNRFDVDRYVQEIYNDKIQELEKQARENPTYYKKGGVIPTDNQDYNYIKYKDLSLSRGTGWLDNYK